MTPPKAAKPTKVAEFTIQQAVARVTEELNVEFDIHRYDIEYPNSVFVLIEGKWFQVTTHEVRGTALLNRLRSATPVDADDDKDKE